MPKEEVLAALAASDNVKVERLVRTFLTAQSLKILPPSAFGDAVNQYVLKDDKHILEQFVGDSLEARVRDMMVMGEEDEDEDLNPLMEQLRERHEDAFIKGTAKLKKTQKTSLKKKPHMWDSDIDGHWEDAPEAFSADEAPAGRRRKGDSEEDEDLSDAGPMLKATTRKAPAKKAPAKPRAPPKAKATAKAKAPAKKVPAKGRKKAVEPSDDEDDEDVIMLDPDSTLQAKSLPKRAVASRGRQSQLNFSQPPKSQTQTIKELSDDEISDDDAFEPMKPSSRRR